MKRRQITPKQWLIVREADRETLWSAARKLPAGSGILLLSGLDPKARRRLRHFAQARSLTIILEAPGIVARVHNLRELTRARLQRVPLIFLSPLFPTESHPHWSPLPRMRAATLARLAKRQAIALGGMNPKRHAKVEALGLTAWAGISAFRT